MDSPRFINLVMWISLISEELRGASVCVFVFWGERGDMPATDVLPCASLGLYGTSDEEKSDKGVR